MDFFCKGIKNKATMQQQQHSTFSVSPSVDDDSGKQRFYQTRLSKVAFALFALTVLLFAGSFIAADVFGGNVEPPKSDCCC